jgi:RNA polymerase sigma factor (sigma-70 family)
MPEVARIARRVLNLFTHRVDSEDLLQAGYVGLVSAANTYHPAVGSFAPYAYWRVRGEMIDSQKRRAFREQLNVSLQAIADANDGWLPPALDRDPAVLPDEAAARAQALRRLSRAIEALPSAERRVFEAHLEGRSLAATARETGQSLAWTRAVLAEARESVAAVVRGG